MSHCNITMRDRHSTVERQAEELHLLRAKNERLETLLSAAESNLRSIFERIKDGADVWLDYDDGTRIDIQAAAPEILEVLKALHAHCTAPDEQMRAAEFVIAKAAAANP